MRCRSERHWAGRQGAGNVHGGGRRRTRSRRKTGQRAGMPTAAVADWEPSRARFLQECLRFMDKTVEAPNPQDPPSICRSRLVQCRSRRKRGSERGCQRRPWPTVSPVARASSKSAWQARAHTHASDADHSSKEQMRMQVCSKTLFYGLVGTQHRCKSLFLQLVGTQLCCKSLSYSCSRSSAVKVCFTAVPAALL